MQTPSQTVSLDLTPDHDEAVRVGLAFGKSIQSILHFDLREEGSHTLCVNISYNESIQSNQENIPSGGRIRSFRKLYQFLVSPCLSVRTKASTLFGVDNNTSSHLSRYALECQLENLADGIITIEELSFEPRSPFKSTSINWDLSHVDAPALAPREVTQVAFMIEQQHPQHASGAGIEVTQDGRTILGVLTIHWRSAMGHLGVLSTGWLTTRRA